MVTRIDRIARSTADLFDILRILESKGVALKATEQPIDTSSALGRSLLAMLGVFAELETNLRRERQMESIRRIQEIDRTKPRHERTYKGRPPTIRPTAIPATSAVTEPAAPACERAVRSASMSADHRARQNSTAMPAVTTLHAIQ